MTHDDGIGCNQSLLQELSDIIKKLEERIIKLEAENDLQLRWMARKDNVAGEEYWEHG